MAIHLKSSESHEHRDAKLHLMPCEIVADGEAKVSQYFEPIIRKVDDTNVLTASFRGRELKGEKIKLPTNYTGVLVKEGQSPFMENEDRNVRITHDFREFTYWNLNTTPTANDAIVKAMAWPEIAQALHSSVKSVNEADSQNSSISGKR